MTEKEALQWKELYVKKRTDANGNIIFPSYSQFLTDLTNAFKPADRKEEAMNKLVNLKQGNRPAEEMITEFRLLAGQAGLSFDTDSDNIHLIGLLRNALRPQLARRILFAEEVPKKIEKWIEKAIQFDNNYRMAMMITGQTSRPNRNPGRTWFPRNEPKDPNAMDVDAMTFEERAALMKKGACFKCKKPGHLARDCPPEKNRIPSKKTGMKDLVTQIRALTKEERDEFLNLMTTGEQEDSGF
jgi:hypothetical protein